MDSSPGLEVRSILAPVLIIIAVENGNRDEIETAYADYRNLVIGQ